MKREVVNPAEVDMVVRDGVAGPNEVVNPLTDDGSTALDIQQKSALRSRKSSLSEIPADVKVADSTLGTMEAMQLEQKRDAIDALIRQRDALKKVEERAAQVVAQGLEQLGPRQAREAEAEALVEPQLASVQTRSAQDQGQQDHSHQSRF